MSSMTQNTLISEIQCHVMQQWNTIYIFPAKGGRADVICTRRARGESLEAKSTRRGRGKSSGVKLFSSFC